MGDSMLINSVIFYINSVIEDLSEDVISDVIVSFFSLDDIIAAKSVLCTLLDVEFAERRGAYKKKSTVSDLYELVKNYKDAELKTIFVTDSYKSLPPADIESLAPMLGAICSNVESLVESNIALREEIIILRHEVTVMHESKMTNSLLQDDIAILRSNSFDIKKILNSQSIIDNKRLSFASNSNFLVLSTPPLSQPPNDSLIDDLFCNHNEEIAASDGLFDDTSSVLLWSSKDQKNYSCIYE